MGGFDDNGSIGDWSAPSPSPRTFFASLMGDDINPRAIPEPSMENNNGSFFPRTEEPMGSRNRDGKVGVQAGNQLTTVSAFPEQKMSSRGSLLERVAARSGFNAPRLNTESIKPPELSQNLGIRSPYFTISPGISPTTLLESPVFVSNSLVQPSPTTGKFGFASNGYGRNSTLVTEAADSGKNNFADFNSSSSFTFKPIAESAPSRFLSTASKMQQSSLQQQPFPSIEVSSNAENCLPSQRIEPSNLHCQTGNAVHHQVDFSKPTTEKSSGVSTIMSEARAFDTIGGTMDHSSPLDEQQDDEADQRGSGDTMIGGALSEDGYNWRKYGQKQVKGSEYPRSYYKCTHPNCPVKKKVERSHEGHITEIIYKGAHNHQKPPPNRRAAVGSSNLMNDGQLDISDQTGGQAGADSDPMWAKGTAAGNPDRRQDNLEVTSSATGVTDYCNVSPSLLAQNGTQFEANDTVDVSSTFSNDEDEDDRGTHGSVSLGYDGEGDESESKRRKIEAYATEMSGATRAIREPRVVVQTTSEVDILDDGYRWRKYGQKVVKGNPNPRSYYKCTSAGCTVRKHVERASHDLKSVITTYEGKHNHDVPAARNSSHVNSAPSSNVPTQATGAVQNHLHRPEPSQVHNMARFDRPPSLGSFGLPGRQLLGPSPGFPFGINQSGLNNLAMANLGPNQGKMPVLPMHPYLGQQQPMNEMGYMLAREPKMEPMMESGPNLSNGSSVCHQIMSRLPLGP